MMTSSGMFTDAPADPTKDLSESERQIALEQLILVQNKLVSGLDEAQALTPDQRAALLQALWAGVAVEIAAKETVEVADYVHEAKEIIVLRETMASGKVNYLIRAANDGMRLTEVDEIAKGFADYMFLVATGNA